ncbi:diguanylate cyclase domain-containing protein [Pseudomonas faucium]|uniref:diguanylate cyclase domain-containing protein n=1 Tax=Pseudomonas faucium TaxID=2740518 RepID=UPI00159699F0|nr:diguanylate cyclase [Pseudomonas faucium]
MSLRKKLLCLLAPSVLLVMILMGAWGHYLLLERLDQEDEQLLMVEADRLRAMMDVVFERDVDRLSSLGTLMQEAGSALPFGTGGFDFLIQSSSGTFTVLQPLLKRSDAAVSAFHPVTLDSLQARIVERLKLPGSAANPASHAELITVLDVPMILASVGTPSGHLWGGTVLDAERVSQLQRQLGGALVWAAPADAARAPSTDADISQMSLSKRQLIDASHQRVDLVFHDSLGGAPLSLRLVRDRHLYQEGLAQLNLFMAFLAASLVLAWGAIHLGLEWFLLRRIRKMHAELASIGPDNPNARLRDRGHDELGDLAHEANRTLDRLEQSEARDAAILAEIQEGYFELDEAGHLQSMNPAFCSQLGYSAEKLSGTAFATLMENDEVLPRMLHPLQRDKGPALSARLRRADGSVGHYQARITPIVDGQKKHCGYRGILHDVSAHVEYQNQLYAMAHNDALTGLGNRKAFHHYLKELLGQHPQPLTLFFIDLDRFKQVNDTFGHEAGDALLVCLARRLENAVRKPDRAFRLGGDEFTLLVRGDNVEDAERLAKRLLDVLSEPVRLGDLTIDYVTPSIGIARSPHHSTDPAELIKTADAAMYEAKQHRNEYHLAN